MTFAVHDADALLDSLLGEHPPLADRSSPVVSYVQSGQTIYTSGQVSRDGLTLTAEGRVGAELDTATGALSARQAAINVLAIVRAAAGSLDRVERVIKLTVFVASAHDYTDQPSVANGASEIFIEVLGERGRHARSAIGVASLPLGAPVEIEAIVDIVARNDGAAPSLENDRPASSNSTQLPTAGQSAPVSAQPSVNDALVERAEKRIPGGVSSNVRLLSPRVFFARGQGAWLWDVEGRDYVDYLLGQGPSFLGHAPRAVVDAVDRASRTGMVFGAQHALEVEAAELLCDTLGWAEMVRFGVSGTESVQAAIRLARAATGRTRFVRFEGHYHGWLDNVLVTLDSEHRTVPASAGQLASALDECISLPWNDAAALERALDEHGDEVAAVIMEPVMLNQGSIEPRPGYLEAARRLCDRHGVVLVFDEVISGFRLSLGGASAHYGVRPDLALYGKALAGGYPVSALAGSAELMAPLGTGAVTHAGTFNASVMAMAAVVATIGELRGDPPYARTAAHGRALAAGLVERARAHGISLRIQGLPMAFHASFGDAEPVYDARGLESLDRSGYATFTHRLVAHGVWVAGRGIWYTSAAHGERELEAALSRAEVAFAEGMPG